MYKVPQSTEQGNSETDFKSTFRIQPLQVGNCMQCIKSYRKDTQHFVLNELLQQNYCLLFSCQVVVSIPVGFLCFPKKLGERGMIAWTLNSNCSDLNLTFIHQRYDLDFTSLSLSFLISKMGPTKKYLSVPGRTKYLESPCSRME